MKRHFSQKQQQMCEIEEALATLLATHLVKHMQLRCSSPLSFFAPLLFVLFFTLKHLAARATQGYGILPTASALGRALLTTQPDTWLRTS